MPEGGRRRRLGIGEGRAKVRLARAAAAGLVDEVPAVGVELLDPATEALVVVVAVLDDPARAISALPVEAQPVVLVAVTGVVGGARQGGRHGPRRRAREQHAE